MIGELWERSPEDLLDEEGHGESCCTEPWLQLEFSSFVNLGELVSSATLLCDPSASLSTKPGFESRAACLDLISSLVSETGVSEVSVVYGFPPSAILEDSYSLFCSHIECILRLPIKYSYILKQTTGLPASDATCEVVRLTSCSKFSSSASNCEKIVSWCCDLR